MTFGVPDLAPTLDDVDEYYADVNQRDEAVTTQPLRQLADPQPRDATVTRELAAYRGLAARWHDWGVATALLRDLAQGMLR